MNSRHALAKERGYKDKPPSAAAFIDAVLEDNNLLRRPILLGKKGAQVGWDEKKIRAFMGG
ncbi:MAG: ArsC/Spx/MgsR family protein [Myxococcota bacterium]